MIDIKITTCAPSWPWLRQLPANSPDWGPFRFHVDTDLDKCDLWFVFESMPDTMKVHCARENTVFITGEPDSIGDYPRQFLAQFGQVVSGRQDVRHPALIRSQQGHPWFVERSYDELKVLPPVPKSKGLCVLTSAKAHTPGHQARLAFVEKLRQRFPGQVDVFGRGIRDFESKWDTLIDYRYSVVMENHHGPDFVTEKLPDAWLAYTMPFYWGCSNLARYCDPAASIPIDPSDEVATFSVIEQHLADPARYDHYLPALSRARDYYLDHMQFFALIRTLAETLIRINHGAVQRQLQVQPASHFVAGGSRRFSLRGLVQTWK
jgi:hypothetical protein